MPARTPEEVDALFEQGINAGDAATVAALYEPTARLVALPGHAVTGTAAILTALEALLASKPRIKQNVVSVLSAGDVAMLYNDWSGSSVGLDGTDSAISGKAIEVVRRQPDGTWLFVLGDPWARGM